MMKLTLSSLGRCLSRVTFTPSMSPARVTFVWPKWVLFHAVTVTRSPSLPCIVSEYLPLNPGKGTRVWLRRRKPLAVSLMLYAVPSGACVTLSCRKIQPAMPCGVGGRVSCTWTTSTVSLSAVSNPLWLASQSTVTVTFVVPVAFARPVQLTRVALPGARLPSSWVAFWLRAMTPGVPKLTVALQPTASLSPATVTFARMETLSLSANFSSAIGESSVTFGSPGRVRFRLTLMPSMSPASSALVRPKCVAFQARTATASPSTPWMVSEYLPEEPGKGILVTFCRKKTLAVSLMLYAVPSGTCVTLSCRKIQPAMPCGVGGRLSCTSTSTVSLSAVSNPLWLASHSTVTVTSVVPVAVARPVQLTRVALPGTRFPSSWVALLRTMTHGALKLSVALQPTASLYATTVTLTRTETLSPRANTWPSTGDRSVTFGSPGLVRLSVTFAFSVSPKSSAPVLPQWVALKARTTRVSLSLPLRVTE